jgi:hypothetical protein
VASPPTFQGFADAMQGHVRTSGEVMGWAAKTDDEK